MTDLHGPITRRSALARAAGLFGALLAPPGLFGRLPGPFPHPDPRPGITAEKVLAPTELGTNKKVLAAYAVARTHPELLDGLYCTCECKESLGHRSLLSCFESKQAAGCWGCREQAGLVAELVEKGQNLEQIRLAFDKKWG